MKDELSDQDDRVEAIINGREPIATIAYTKLLELGGQQLEDDGALDLGDSDDL